MKFTSKITGQNAENTHTAVIKDVTTDVYYQESGYNFYRVLSTGAFEFYLREFIVPISIYLGPGTSGTLEIFPPEVGGDTIDGAASITLSTIYDGVTLYSLGGGRYGASYWKSSGGGAFTDLTDVPANYTGQSLKVVRVNAGETGLEFATISGGSLTVTQIEQNLSATPTWRGKFTVVDAGVTGTSKILIWQAFAELTGKGTLADENEMDTLIVNAAAGTGQFTVYWQTQPQYVTRIKELRGHINNRPNLTNPLNDVGNYTEQVRIGKVKGNFKFNYTIS